MSIVQTVIDDLHKAIQEIENLPEEIAAKIKALFEGAKSNIAEVKADVAAGEAANGSAAAPAADGAANATTSEAASAGDTPAPTAGETNTANGATPSTAS